MHRARHAGIASKQMLARAKHGILVLKCACGALSQKGHVLGFGSALEQRVHRGCGAQRVVENPASSPPPAETAAVALLELAMCFKPGFRERVVNLCPRISDWEVHLGRGCLGGSLFFCSQRLHSSEPEELTLLACTWNQLQASILGLHQEEYYLNDDAENVHARVYKSASAQALRWDVFACFCSGSWRSL